MLDTRIEFKEPQIENQELIELCETINNINQTLGAETLILRNPTPKEEGGENTKIYFFDGMHKELHCFDTTLHTIGEHEYLVKNLPNVTVNKKTVFWEDPTFFLCKAIFAKDIQFEMVQQGGGFLGHIKIENNKLYYNEYKPESAPHKWRLIEPKKPKTRNFRNGLTYETQCDLVTHKYILWILTYYQDEIKFAVMHNYKTYYCETVKYGTMFELRY